MVRICFTEDKDSMTLVARGHANYSDAGSDIVCAAVSTLTQALAVALDYEHDNGAYKTFINTYAYDAFRVSVTGIKEEKRELTKALFMMAYNYLKVVADNYPENVVVEQGCTY